MRQLPMIPQSTPQQIVKAKEIEPEIRNALASFPMNTGITLTAQIALWHVQRVEFLENQLENLRGEREGR